MSGGIKVNFNVQSQLFILSITTIVIVIAFLTYYFMQKKQNVIAKERRGYVLVMDRFIQWVDELVMEVMGPNFRWFTPYAIYLLLYIGVGNLTAIIGWESPITAYTVTFCLGFITFIGIYVAGICAHKARFFLKYITNPAEIITQFAPLISITFRIFGNLTAGSVILFLLYTLTANATNNVPFIGYINIIGGFVASPLSFYFDLFDGLIQTYIFMILTLAYIGIEAEHKEGEKKKQKKRVSLHKMNSIFFHKNKKEEKKVVHEHEIGKEYDLIRS